MAKRNMKRRSISPLSRFKNYYWKGRSCLAVLRQSFNEVRCTFLYANELFDDAGFLEAVIRKDAHVLEKEIKNLFQGRTEPINHKLICDRLKDRLVQWKEKKYKISDTIRWSEKILVEYENHLKSNWICELIGDAEDKKSSTDNLNSLIRERRSIRHWKSDKIKKDKIDQLIDAARWAPSSCNRQTWHFIVIKDQDIISKITKTIRGGDPFFAKAPLLIMVLIDFRPYSLPEEKYTIYQDAAAAIQNMLLMAHNLGLGACWASYTSDSNIIINERMVRNALGIPDYFKIGGMVAVGRPDEDVCIISRRNIEDIISFNKFKKN
jgi:nitroreductase